MSATHAGSTSGGNLCHLLVRRTRNVAMSKSVAPVILASSLHSTLARASRTARISGVIARLQCLHIMNSNRGRPLPSPGRPTAYGAEPTAQAKTELRRPPPICDFRPFPLMTANLAFSAAKVDRRAGFAAVARVVRRLREPRRVILARNARVGPRGPGHQRDKTLVGILRAMRLMATTRGVCW